MQVNIKRVLSFLVVLAMVLSMAPVTGIPAIEAKAETAAAEEHVFDPAAEKNYCEHCKEEVVWTPLHNGESIAKVTEGGKYHYYVAEDMTAADGNFLPDHGAAVAANYSLCLQLNGKKLTVKSYLYCGRQWTINVMGDGEMINSHNSNPMFYVWTCDVNLYGGTFSGPNAVKLDGDNAKVYLHNDATINSNVIALKGNLYLNDSAIVNNVQLSGSCKLNLAEGWKGGAKLNVDSALVEEDGKTIKAANVVIGGAYTGQIAWDGYKVENNNGALTKGDAKAAFDASAEVSYCEACDAFTTWTALHNGEKVTNASTHWYVAEDMEGKANERLIFGGDFKDIGHVCLNLNGKTVTTKSGGSAAIYGSNGVTFNIMGEGTVINGGTGLLFEVYTCNMYLYGGTYISGGTAAKKAMSAAGSATKVYMYNDVKFEGVVEAKAGAITLNDEVSIEGILFNGGTVTAAAGWTGYLKNTDGKYVELVDGVWKEVIKTPEWGVFDPVVCGGYAYCEACGQDADPVLWEELADASKYPGYLVDTAEAPVADKHYYLSADIRYSADKLSQPGQWIGLNGVAACLNLNGHTLTCGSRLMVTGDATTYLNIIANGGSIVYTGAAENHTQGFMVSRPINFYGGTYTSQLLEGVDKPLVQIQNANGILNCYDATFNGRVELRTSSMVLHGTSSANNVQITSYIGNDGTTTYNSTGKLVFADGWSGTVKLTVREDLFTNGVLSASAYQIDGNFAGTVICNGTELTYQDGVLMANMEFDPEAETNYCTACKAFVAWTALEEGQHLGDCVGEHYHFYVPADMTAGTITKNNIQGFLPDLGADTAAKFKLCLHLNGKTLKTDRFYCGRQWEINIMGDGRLEDSTPKSRSLFEVYTADLNLYGGTYVGNGDNVLFLAGGNAKVYLHNDVKIEGTSNINLGKLYINDSASLDTLKITGGLTTIAENWNGSMILDASAVMVDGKVPAANLVVTGGKLNGTITNKNGVNFVYADGQLALDTTFNPDAETSYCRVCDASVAWEALPETLDSKALEVGHHHYYVAEDMTNKDPTLFIVDEGGHTFCLNLNGKTLTLKGCLYGSWLATINVIGDGTVVSTGGKTLCGASCYMHLYGGTYIASATGNALDCYESGTPKFYLHEDAKLVGNTVIDKGELHLYDQAEIETLNIKGGKTTFHAGWSGSAALNVAEDLVTDGVVNAANAVAEAGITGKLTDAFGSAYTVNGTSLVVPAVSVDPDVFEPWNHNGYAYCDCAVCDGKQQLVKWIDFNDFVEENGFYDGIDGKTLSVEGLGKYHFYLSEDLTYATHVLNTYEAICFNFNGYDINPVAKEGAEAITASYAFSGTQTMILMNTATEMSTVTGWQTKAGDSTVLWLNGGNASSTVYLMDNVTLKTHESCTTDAPVVRIAGNGGKFYMEGGIIDASKKSNTDYPCAVYVEGQGVKNAAGNEIFGKFYMNGGEIKGGTSVNSAGAVAIGYRSTSENYLDGAFFYMNGGTISGGKSKSGGNLYISKNAKEVVINGTITGGEATVSGGNIYSTGADLTIGEKAVISGGLLPFVNMGTAGIGGGNIYFADGTFTTSGTITGGTVEKFKGAGGNIFLDGSASTTNGITFIMNGGTISGGKIPTGEEEIYGGTDFGGQSYGANIRGYKVKEMKLLGGTIEGGQGGNATKVDGRDVYLGCSADVVTDLTIGDVTINGAVLLARHKLTLTGAPKINSVDGENGLTVGETVEMNISGLTEGADIELSNIVANIPLTVACDNAEALKAYFTVIGMDGAVLNVVENQLILVGVAIVDGEEATWYATAAEAIAAYTADDYAAGKYIQLGLDATVALAGAEYLIDLAGQVAGEVAITGTGIAHLFDTANLDLDGYRTVTVAETVTLAERDHNVVVGGEAYRFIIVTDAEGKTSAHCLAMAVNGVNLNTEKAGLSYNAEYECDAYLAEMISAYGVILSLKDMPGAVMDGSDERTVLTTFAPVNNKVTSTSSTVSGIFKDNRTAARNAQYGKMKIYANAYIELDLDGDGTADILVADNENAGKKAGNAWSLYDVLLNIDQNWDDNAANQEAAKAFFDQWFDLGTGLYADDFTNLDVKVDVEGGEGEGVTPEDTDVDVEV